MLDKYATKQEDLKEEPIEVGDDIESVAGSDDEEDEDGLLEDVEDEEEMDMDQLMEEESPEPADEVENPSADEALINGHHSPITSESTIDSRPPSSSDDAPPKPISVIQPFKKEAMEPVANGVKVNLLFKTFCSWPKSIQMRRRRRDRSL